LEILEWYNDPNIKGKRMTVDEEEGGI